MKELLTLVNRGAKDPSIDATAFPNATGTSSDFYWSATQVLGNRVGRWYVAFDRWAPFQNISAHPSRVRCVR